jgi:hypothetical protein
MFEPRRTAPALAALALLAIPLAGCGGGSANASGDNSDQARLNFARCMRSHGVNLPDPQSGGNGVFRQRLPGNIAPARMQAAMKACQKELPNGGPGNRSPAEQAKFRDAALKFARCMRSHGVNVPDPQVNGGAGLLRLGPASGVNPSSPAFQKAQQACQNLLPGPPGGRRGGGQGGGVQVGP